jgi:hypothetical protein
MPNLRSRDALTHSPKNKKRRQFYQNTGIDLPFAKDVLYSGKKDKFFKISYLNNVGYERINPNLNAF